MTQSEKPAHRQQEVAADDPAFIAEGIIEETEFVCWQNILNLRLAELDQLPHCQVHSLLEHFNINSNSGAKEFFMAQIAVLLSPMSEPAHRRNALEKLKYFYARIDQAKQNCASTNASETAKSPLHDQTAAPLEVSISSLADSNRVTTALAEVVDAEKAESTAHDSPATRSKHTTEIFNALRINDDTPIDTSPYKRPALTTAAAPLDRSEQENEMVKAAGSAENEHGGSLGHDKSAAGSATNPKSNSRFCSKTRDGDATVFNLSHGAATVTNQAGNVGEKTRPQQPEMIYAGPVGPNDIVFRPAFAGVNACAMALLRDALLKYAVQFSHAQSTKEKLDICQRVHFRLCSYGCRFLIQENAAPTNLVSMDYDKVLAFLQRGLLTAAKAQKNQLDHALKQTIVIGPSAPKHPTPPPPTYLIHRSDVQAKDVLIKKSYEKFPGNLFWKHQQELFSMQGHDELSSCRNAIRSVDQTGGRFLKPADTEDEFWELIHENEVLTIIRKQKRKESQESVAAKATARTNPRSKHSMRDETFYSNTADYDVRHMRMGYPPMMRNYPEDSGAHTSPPPGKMPPNFPPPPEFRAPPSMVSNKGGPQNTIMTLPYQSSPKVGPFGWSKEEDGSLTEIMKKYQNPRDWEPIAKEHNRGRTAKECHERWIRYLKPGVRKGQWTDHEDAIVMDVVTTSNKQPFTQWSDLAQHLPGRVGKQIRDRWVNHLNPAINHLPFSRKEDLLLWEGHKKLGKLWVEISTKKFNGTRSERQIKNRWRLTAFKQFIKNEFGPDKQNGGSERPSL